MQPYNTCSSDHALSHATVLFGQFPHLRICRKNQKNFANLWKSCTFAKQFERKINRQWGQFLSYKAY